MLQDGSGRGTWSKKCFKISDRGTWSKNCFKMSLAEGETCFKMALAEALRIRSASRCLRQRHLDALLTPSASVRVKHFLLQVPLPETFSEKT